MSSYLNEALVANVLLGVDVLLIVSEVQILELEVLFQHTEVLDLIKFWGCKASCCGVAAKPEEVTK